MTMIMLIIMLMIMMIIMLIMSENIDVVDQIGRDPMIFRIFGTKMDNFSKLRPSKTVPGAKN